jgi:tricorn protease
MDPVWLGNVVYFLSDRDGVSNVWGYDTRTKKLGQITNYSDFDVKTLDAGGGVLVFEQAGNIHEIDPGNERDRVVNITAPPASARRSRRAARSSRSPPRRATSAT